MSGFKFGHIDAGMSFCGFRFRAPAPVEGRGTPGGTGENA